MFVLFFWIIFGGLVGWIMGLVRNIPGLNVMGGYILLGMVGGVIGGFGSSWLLRVSSLGYDNDLTSMMFAIVGSVIIVILLATADRKQP